MKKCIVFDVDRTLVDSYLPELLSLQEAIENITNKKISKEEMEKLTSLPTKEFFKYINLTDKEIESVNKEWEKTFSKYKTKCFANIREVIKELNNKGYIIAVITSRTMKEYHELDDELSDISNLFKVVVTSDLVKKPKPFKDSINYLCDYLNISCEDIIYIGDNSIDKEFSNNSNISFIPACWDNKALINEENACIDPQEIIKKIANF